MLIGGLFEVFLGVRAAGKSLGSVTKPLASFGEKARHAPPTLTASHVLDAAGNGESIRKHFNLPDRLGPTLGNPAALASCTVAACHARYLAGWLGGLDDRGVQAGFGFVHADNADAGKADRLQQVAVLRLGKGAVGAADLLLGLGELAGVDAFVCGDIGDAQPSAGPEHPESLGEDARLVGGQVNHAVGDDDVDLLVRQRDVFNVAVQEPDVGDPRLNGVGAGEGQHVAARVQTVGDAVRCDPASGEQYVEAAAGAEVQNGLARLEVGHGHRVAAAEAGAKAASGATAAMG